MPMYQDDSNDVYAFELVSILGSKMHVVLAEKGSSLVSRTRGAAVREMVLASGGVSEPITLDFAGVARASYSFIDELVGCLATMHAEGQIRGPVETCHAGDMIAFHLEQCLARRLGELQAA